MTLKPTRWAPYDRYKWSYGAPISRVKSPQLPIYFPGHCQNLGLIVVYRELYYKVVISGVISPINGLING